MDLQKSGLAIYLYSHVHFNSVISSINYNTAKLVSKIVNFIF